MNKKILIFNLTPRCGMLHYSSQFCNELSKKKWYTINVAIAKYYEWPLYNQNIKKIKISTHPHWFSFIKESLMIRNHIKFFNKIKKFNPDIVHFIDNHPWYLIYSSICKRLWYKIYTTQHNPTQHSGENKTLLGKVWTMVNKKLRKISDILIVHGDVLKNDLVKNYKVEPQKIITIPHWNYTFFNKRSEWLSTKKNHFLFFWRINDYKGLDILLKSLEYIKKEIDDFKLLIVWKWDLQKYQKLLDKFQKYIEIHNFEIRDEDIHKYFEISEFVVLPYKDATGSGIIPIAYCFKKPVIATNVWWLPDAVITWKTGLLVEPNNPKILSDAIIKLLTNKKDTIEMGKKWMQFTDKYLSWKPIIDKIYK